MQKQNRKPIDVLFLAWDDNANTGYRFWQCAKMLGLNSIMFKGKAHPFGYPDQAPIHPSLANPVINNAPITILAPGLESLIKSSTVVHLIASTFPFCAVDWGKINIVVQHGGTAYRQNPERCNEVFNPIASHTVIQCPDLLGLGAENEHLIYYPVDTELIQPDYSFRRENTLTIGHFPSNPRAKGTAAIGKVITELHKEHNGAFDYIGESSLDKPTMLLPWSQHLERLKKCDIIIETCQPNQENKVYGEWGNQALEAAAAGCIVVTNSLSEDIYMNAYGQLGLCLANDPDKLHKVLDELINMDRVDVLKLKKISRAWAEKHHSIKATAVRLWQRVYKHFFE